MKKYKAIIYIQAENRKEANKELQRLIVQVKKRQIHTPKEIAAGERDKMSRKQRFRILKRDNFTCQMCGRKSPDVELHIDHKIPVSKGGKTVDDNLVTLCSDCNFGKAGE